MSEAVKRLRTALLDVLTEDVRQALRQGQTIAQIMERFPAVTRKFVERQRAILSDREVLPDARRSTVGDEIRRLDELGCSAVEIAKKLRVSPAYVYQQRRVNKK